MPMPSRSSASMEYSAGWWASGSGKIFWRVAIAKTRQNSTAPLWDAIRIRKRCWFAAVCGEGVLAEGVLNDQPGVEVPALQEVRCGLLYRLTGQQANNLAFEDAGPESAGFPGHCFENSMQRRLFVIGQVDGDLRQVA